MATIDLRRILKRHTLRWVLISKDYKRVLVSARTLKNLLKVAPRDKDGYVLRVAKDYSRYVGN